MNYAIFQMNKVCCLHLKCTSRGFIQIIISCSKVQLSTFPRQPHYERDCNFQQEVKMPWILVFALPNHDLLWPFFPCGSFLILQVSEEQGLCRAWPSAEEVSSLVQKQETPLEQQAVTFKLVWISPELSDATFLLLAWKRMCQGMEGGSSREIIKDLTKGRVCWSGTLLNWLVRLQTKSCEVLLVLRCSRWISKPQKELGNWWVVPLENRSGGRS